MNIIDALKVNFKLIEQIEKWFDKYSKWTRHDVGIIINNDLITVEYIDILTKRNIKTYDPKNISNSTFNMREKGVYYLDKFYTDFGFVFFVYEYQL